MVLFGHFLNSLLPALNMRGTEMKDLTDRVKPMTDTVAEMSHIVRALSEPWQPGDSVKAAINRVSRLTELGTTRLTTFWYSRPCAVLAGEADHLRALYSQHLEREITRSALRLALLRERQEALKEKQNAVVVAQSQAREMLRKAPGMVSLAERSGELVRGSGEQVGR